MTFFASFEKLKKAIAEKKFSTAAKIINAHTKNNLFQEEKFLREQKHNYHIWIEELQQLCKAQEKNPNADNNSKIEWTLNLIESAVHEMRIIEKELKLVF